MKATSVKYIIVGAGLSGLTTANILLENGETNFIIIEGRNRIGGRIMTKNTIDLGATWFQDHHLHLNDLLQQNDIRIFEQFSKGQSVLVYNTRAPAHHFESQQHAPSAFRIVGGTTALIKNLSKKLKDKIILDTKVLEIQDEGNSLFIKTAQGNFIAKKAVVTIPPKLASTLSYTPQLPTVVKNTMEHTHTWMSNAIKVGLLFDEPFWRQKNLSGTVIGQVGPVIELYDHCNFEHNTFGLMGFVNEGLRDTPYANRKERVLSYLEKYLGKEIYDHTSYIEKDWSKDLLYL